MARQGRRRSESGIYHIILRGIDRRDIFIDDEDKIKFIESLTLAKEKGGFELYAYCLMDNHIHLLIKEAEEIGNSMKRITVAYVAWHNRKYERTGHLFQNRFRSEPVETDSYLITVSRYIHQNPVKAGMVSSVADYPWNSYTHYINAYLGHSSIIDTQLIEEYFATQEKFVDFMNEINQDECLDHQPTKKYNDENFRVIIQKKYSIDDLTELPIEARDKLISQIYNDLDISIRQLSKALGISKSTVERAIKRDK